MDPLELLQDQHGQLASLVAQIEADRSFLHKRMLTEALASQLRAHDEMEERVLYPAVYPRKTTSATDGACPNTLHVHAIQEHRALNQCAIDLAAMNPDHENFLDKVRALKQQLEHHVADENKLLAVLRATLSEQERAMLAAEMERTYEGSLAAIDREGRASARRAKKPQ